MKKLFIQILVCLMAFAANAQTTYQHPWQGARVGYIGDSILDPNFSGITHLWDYLRDWLDITPLVYAVSGYEWWHAPQLIDKMISEQGQNLDAIIVFLGTNDFNSSVPIGEFYEVKDEPMMRACGKPKAEMMLKHRSLVFSETTLKGRINIAMKKLKSAYPTKQIVLLTPIHRALADFGNSNYQPDESYANEKGYFISDYVDAVKEAGSVWSVPVIDLNALSGLNPMVEEQLLYFNNPKIDQLHPNSKGHERLAKTLVQQLLTLPLFK